MRHTYVHTTFKSELRFMTLYTCAYCGTQNADENFLRLKGSVPGAVVRDPVTGKMRSLTSAQYFAEKLQNIKNGDVTKVRLNACCIKCRKRPAWAHYPRKAWHIVALVFGILGGLIALGTLMQAINGTAVNWLVFARNIAVAAALLFVSLPFYKTRCRARDKKIAALTPEQLPKILVLPKEQ